MKTVYEEVVDLLRCHDEDLRDRKSDLAGIGAHVIKELTKAQELPKRILAACSAAENMASAARGRGDGPPAQVSTAFIRRIVRDCSKA